MILAIDIGNTYTKIGVFEEDELLQVEQSGQDDGEKVGRFLEGYKVDEAVVSSVKGKKNAVVDMLTGKVPLTFFNAGMTTGITNHYLTPETLGVDRLAAVAGAYYLYPGQNSLVISGGTAITYDWVDAEGNYFGGSISPGLNMRYRALNNYTAGLPLVTPDESFAGDYGNDTTAAIRSGVQNGIKYELTGFIQSHKKQGDNLNILLSGGDSIFFDTLLKNSIFAPYIKIEPHLVLKGLNAAIRNNND